MKKILFFTENYVRGGGNRYMIDLINALSNEYNKRLIVSNNGGIFFEDINRLDSKVECKTTFFLSEKSVAFSQASTSLIKRRLNYLILLMSFPLFFLCNVIIFVFFLLQNKPSQIVCCNGGYPGARSCLAMCIAGKILRIPVVLSIVSMPVPRVSYIRQYEQIIDKMLWKSVSIVIVNAKSIKVALRDLRGLAEKRVEIIFNGVCDKRRHFSQRAETKKFVIGCVARMDVSKGVLFLLEAFAVLSKTYDHLSLMLVGKGDASITLEKRVEELGLQKSVKLLGYYDGDIYELINRFDVYVFPSLWEGLPYSLIEALCSSCAIVATNVGGIPEIITDGIDGLLIAPGSDTAIIDALKKLINNPHLCKKLSKNARRRFENELALHYMYNRAKEVFSSLY